MPIERATAARSHGRFDHAISPRRFMAGDLWALEDDPPIPERRCHPAIWAMSRLGTPRGTAIVVAIERGKSVSRSAGHHRQHRRQLIGHLFAIEPIRKLFELPLYRVDRGVRLKARYRSVGCAIVS